MKYISFLLFNCMLICMSTQNATAMKRSLEEGSIEQPIFSLLTLNQDIKNEILEQAISKTEQVQVSKTTLRLVCKMTYEFCDKDKKYIFNKENFSSFKKEIGNLWAELLLSKLSHLTFLNSITSSALDNELEPQEWEDTYVFISREDLEYIMKHATELKQLHFFNVPFLITPTKPTFAYSSLEYFGFHYDTEIFDASISSADLYDCHQFTNLKSIMINSGVFFSDTCSREEDPITNFFSPLTNLKTLRLYDVEDDQENIEYSTNLFKPLICLKKLDTLEISFLDKPDLLPLTNLSSLGLKNLTIIFETEIGEIGQEASNYSGILPLLLKALPDLESIAFYNIWVEIFGPEMAEIISNNERVLKKYPQLKEVKGNDVLSFDSNDNNPD